MTDAFHRLEARLTPAFDAVIVGDGPAGLSAALVLGRARKRVLRGRVPRRGCGDRALAVGWPTPSAPGRHAIVLERLAPVVAAA